MSIKLHKSTHCWFFWRTAAKKLAEYYLKAPKKKYVLILWYYNPSEGTENRQKYPLILWLV